MDILYFLKNFAIQNRNILTDTLVLGLCDLFYILRSNILYELMNLTIYSKIIDKTLSLKNNAICLCTNELYFFRFIFYVEYIIVEAFEIPYYISLHSTTKYQSVSKYSTT